MSRPGYSLVVKLVRIVNVDWKSRAIEQWTADPCGPEGETIDDLIRGRHDYAPWMAGALGYAGTDGLDVLDVGCGQGIDLCQYAAAGARVTGIDLTPRHVELARQYLADLGLDGIVVEGDAEALPFADGRFDRVFSNGVLHHTPDMPAALRGIHRVLKPGGRVTLIVYNRNSWHFWLNQICYHGICRGWLFSERSVSGVLSRGVERTSIGAKPLVRVYTRRRLARMLREAGLRNVRVSISPMRPKDTVLHVRLPGGGWYLIGYAEKAVD
jgi:ubiquinone/menaquinone biosynthesis C-methylase UbiE